MTLPRQQYLTWQESRKRSWLVLGFIGALGLEGLSIGLGYLHVADKLAKLIKNGETVAIDANPAPPPPPVEIELVDTPPPPEANPEFVVPIEVPKPPPPEAVETDEEEEPTPIEPPPTPTPQQVQSQVQVAQTPQPPTPQVVQASPSPPLVEPAPAAPAPPVPAPAPAPAPIEDQYAAEPFHLGDKGFPVPPYPYEAKIRHFQGTVVITILVENGQKNDVQVAGSSGYGMLDQSAVNWIRRRWNTFPDQLSGSFRVPIQYRLN